MAASTSRAEGPAEVERERSGAHRLTSHGRPSTVTLVGADSGDEDDELWSRVVDGDRGALGKLYDRYGGLMLAIARRIMGDSRETEDLVHDVFLEAWRQAADFDPERGSVRAWLVLRLRSRALDRRKSAGFSRVDSIDADPAFQARADESEDPTLSPDRQAVRRCLAALPLEQRQVLLLGYFEGLSSSEIAERLGTPIGTVKSRVAAAMTRLRSALRVGALGEP
jgi:RNA polymerase sigma-70 factor (ECF subfamily)